MSRSHSNIDSWFRESYNGIFKSLKLVFQLLLVSLELCCTVRDRQSFQLFLCLSFGFFKVAECLLALFFWHESRAWWMLRHLSFLSFLLGLLFTLILELIQVIRHLSIVLVFASNDILIILLFRVRRFHLENGLIHISFDIVFLLTLFQSVQLVCFGHGIFC